MAGSITGNGGLGAGANVVVAQGKVAWAYAMSIEPGTAASSVELRTAGASGPIRFSLGGGANTGPGSASFPIPIRCDDGITLVVNGTGCRGAVAWSTTPPEELYG